MSEIQPQDILLYAGGDSWNRFGTFTRRTSRWQRSGESQKETFARADASECATYLGRDGLVHLAAAGVIRPHWADTNGDGIPDTLTYRAEPGAINRLLQSAAWATAPWGNNVVTPTNAFATDPEGTTTATKLLPNNTGANNNPYATQGAIAITAGEFLAVSVYVKANGYGAIVLRCSDATSTNGFQVSFDLVNGVFGSLGNGFGAGVLTGKTFENLGNGWYRVGIWGQINGGVVTGQLFNYVYDTIAHANTQTAYTADGVSSILGFGGQFERNGVTNALPPTSYIPTGAATVTRTADTCTVAVQPDTFPLSIYAKFIERGAASLSGGVTRVFEISRFGSNPRLLLYATAGKYSMALVTAGASQFESSAALAPTYGQIVELCGSFDGSSAVSLTQAINGVAGTPVVSAAAPAGAAAWGVAVSGIMQAGDPGVGCAAPGDVQRIVLAAGVHTLAEFQAVP